MVLAAGTTAPDFTLTDQHGTEVTLSEAVQSGPVALVFFPLAFSGICTGELCELRDNLAVFDDAKVRMFTISVDSVHTLRAFAESESYEFSMLSDFWPHGAVAQAYGVFLEEAGIANRATVIIGQDQTIVASFETAVGEPRDLEAYREALATLA